VPCARHDWFICATWLIYMCDNPSICAVWLVHACDMTHSSVRPDSFICATRLIHVHDMTHSCVWYDSFMCVHDSCVCVLWPIRVPVQSVCIYLNITWWWEQHQKKSSHLRCDAFICATWLMYACDITHSFVWRVSLMCVTWLIHQCDVSRSCVWHDSFISVTCLTLVWSTWIWGT